MKYSYIQIHPSSLVILKSPPLSKSKALALIEEQIEWINKLQKKVAGSKPQNPAKNQYLYLGHFYPLEIITSSQTTKPQIDYDNFVLKASLPEQPIPEQIDRALDYFYRTKAQQKIPLILKEWCDSMQLWPRELVIKKQKKRWGSCTSKGKILINYQCIKLPIECIELVLVHELAHLKIPNHSRKFWDLVALYLPDLKERKKLLKDFSLRYSEYFY